MCKMKETNSFIDDRKAEGNKGVDATCDDTVNKKCNDQLDFT